MPLLNSSCSGVFGTVVRPSASDSCAPVCSSVLGGRPGSPASPGSRPTLLHKGSQGDGRPGVGAASWCAPPPPGLPVSPGSAALAQGCLVRSCPTSQAVESGRRWWPHVFEKHQCVGGGVCGCGAHSAGECYLTSRVDHILEVM